MVVTTVDLELGPPGARSSAGTQLPTNGAEMVAFGASGSALALEIRVSAAGQWSQWQRVESEEHEAPDDGPELEPGRTGIAPVWIGSDATAVEVRSAVGSTDIEVSLYQINEVAAVAALGESGRPAIHRRSEWTKAGWSTRADKCGLRPDYAPTLRAIVVHHTVTTNAYSQGQVPGIIAGIRDYHVNTRGWCDIGYNFLIDRFGGIWEGRYQSLDQLPIGGHSQGVNAGTVGIALLGTHGSSAPTSASAAALRSMAEWELGRFGVDPDGTTYLYNAATGSGVKLSEGWVEVPAVVGHRDLVFTDCPGGAAVGLYGSLRTIDPNRVGSPPYDVSQWSPRDSGAALVGIDRYGGLRPGLAASQISPTPEPSANGAVIAVDATVNGGYALLADGRLRAFGGAPAVSTQAANAVDLVVRSNGSSGWILRSNGELVSFGGAANIGDLGGGTFVALALDDEGRGYGLTSAGKLLPAGGRSATSVSTSSAVDVALRSNGTSGWVVAADGKLYPFGGAPAASVALGNGKAVAVVASAHDDGGWVLNSHGQWRQFGSERRAWPQSSTVGFADTVDGDLVTYRADESFRTTHDGGFVDRLAGVFLDQNPTPMGLDLLDRRLETEGTTDVIEEMAYSTEFAGEIIDSMYSDVLGRLPDAGGRQYWLDEMRNGLTVQGLGTYFYASEEYRLVAGSNQAFVSNLYRDLLARQPDADGLAYWTGLLDRNRANPDDITWGFFASDESLNQRAQRLFRRLVGTSVPAYELDDIIEQIRDEGDIEAAVSIAKSDPFEDAGPYPG